MAQRLQLSQQYQCIHVDGNGGNEHTLSTHSVVTITIANLKSTTCDKISGPHRKIEVVVLPKVASNLQVVPVSFGPHWKHLTGLRVADAEVGTPRHINIYLGIDVFNQVVR